MLTSTLALHDVRDAEAFCASILRRKGIPVDEDTLAYLVGECWILSTRFDGTQGSRFSAWAKLTLERRLIDRARKEHGDHRYHSGRNRPQFHPLADTLPAIGSDPAEDRDPDLERLLAARGGTLARDLETLGLHAPRRVA